MTDGNASDRRVMSAQPLANFLVVLRRAGDGIPLQLMPVQNVRHDTMSYCPVHERRQVAEVELINARPYNFARVIRVRRLPQQSTVGRHLL